MQKASRGEALKDMPRRQWLMYEERAAWQDVTMACPAQIISIGKPFCFGSVHTDIC